MMIECMLGWRTLPLNVVLSSCCARKDDSVPIPAGARVVEPSYYLNQSLIGELLNTRERIFLDPRAHVGVRSTYAFDAYVRTGKAYKELFEISYDRLKAKLLSSNSIEWFFLSGGYGVIHALERARSYQATFTYGIAHQNNIPHTAKLWKPVLSQLCDDISARFNPDLVYVFGSSDYTEFIKETSFWKRQSNVRMFESTGRSGTTWLSPIMNELVCSMLQNNIEPFNSKYDKFTKQ